MCPCWFRVLLGPNTERLPKDSATLSAVQRTMQRGKPCINFLWMSWNVQCISSASWWLSQPLLELHDASRQTQIDVDPVRMSRKVRYSENKFCFSDMCLIAVDTWSAYPLSAEMCPKFGFLVDIVWDLILSHGWFCLCIHMYAFNMYTFIHTYVYTIYIYIYTYRGNVIECQKNGEPRKDNTQFVGLLGLESWPPSSLGDLHLQRFFPGCRFGICSLRSEYMLYMINICINTYVF